MDTVGGQQVQPYGELKQIKRVNGDSSESLVYHKMKNGPALWGWRGWNYFSPGTVAVSDGTVTVGIRTRTGYSCGIRGDTFPPTIVTGLDALWRMQSRYPEVLLHCWAQSSLLPHYLTLFAVILHPLGAA